MAELVIKISGDIKNYEDALDKASKETAGLSDSLSSVAQKSAIAFAALTAEIGFSVAAYRQSEEATNRLSAALQNQGIFSRDLVDKYKDQATAIQNLTGISDEAILNAQTAIQGYIGQKEVTQELTLAIADFAKAQGVDLSTAAQLVGKSIGTSTNALTRYGIEVDASATKAEKLDQVIVQLNARYSGQAAAAGAGLGAIVKLKETFGDLQEEIGARFAPALTFVANKLNQMLIFIKDNKGLVDFIAALLTAGAVVTGLATAVTLGGIAFLKLRAAMAAANVTMSLMTVGVRALVGATGLGLIVFAVTELALNWNTAWPRMQAVFQAFVNNISGLLGGLGTLLAGVFTANLENIKAGGRQLKEAFARGFNEATVEIKAPEVSEESQNQALADAAAKRESLQQDHEERMAEIRRLAREVEQLERQQASEFLIEAKRQELESLKALDDENYEGDREVQLARYEEARAIRTEQQAAEYAVQQEKLAQQRQANDTFLKEQVKFGTAYATINKIMHSTIVQGSAQAFGELAALQQSNNSALKGIGKAAATAQIIFQTATSAMNIYAGFSTIPIIGPALGIAGAAAAIAFGAEQIGKVNAAADGGLITGPGGPTADVIPAMLSNGELVVPARNFEEVVGAVASQRSGVGTGQEQQTPPQSIELVLTLKDNLMDFIDVQANERERLGISLRTQMA